MQDLVHPKMLAIANELMHNCKLALTSASNNFRREKHEARTPDTTLNSFLMMGQVGVSCGRRVATLDYAGETASWILSPLHHGKRFWPTLVECTRESFSV